MLAIPTLHVDARGFGGKSAGSDDNSGDSHEMGDICRCEASNGGLRDRGVDEELVFGE